MQKLKQILYIALFTLIVANPVVVMAQGTTNTNTPSSGVTGSVTTYKGVESSITEYLCTPSVGADGRDLERCVNKLYRFGIAFGAIALVFFIVFAGYMYMSGGETSKGKAKGILQNALVGMGILLFSYVLLRFINPNLVLFKPIQPPIFTSADLPTCAALGLGDGCVVATGSGFSGSTGNGSIVKVAQREIGTKGAMNDFPKFISIALANNTGPAIAKYFVPGGTPGQPWCAYFATWVYGQAGIKTLGNLPGRGGTLTVQNYFKSKNGTTIAEGTIRYFSADQIISGSATVLPGDLVFYDRGTSGDANGHTAIVTGYDPAAKKMSSIDGNQDQTDEVKTKIRDVTKPCTGEGTCKMLGVGRVEIK